MSLAALAKTLKPTTMFDKHPLSKQFCENFPIITLDLGLVANKTIHEDQDMTLNENLERQIRELGDAQQFQHAYTVIVHKHLLHILSSCCAAQAQIVK